LLLIFFSASFAILTNVIIDVLGFENSLTMGILRVSAIILGMEFFLVVVFYLTRKMMRVDMKQVRRDILINIDMNELESLDQIFELVTLIIGACFAVLFFLIPESYQLSPISVQIAITGMFYLGYKIARIKLAIDLRIWIISIGIGTSVMFVVFLMVFAPLMVLLPIFYTAETAMMDGLFISAFASYFLGRYYYARKMVDIVDRLIEKMLLIKDEIEKERLKEHLLYPVENENIPLAIPLTIGVLAILPWLSVSYFDIMGTLAVLVVILLVLYFVSFFIKQYNIFVHPLGPSEGIEDGPAIPRRIVQDEQIEEMASIVYKSIFGKGEVIEFNGKEYSISRTQRNNLKSLTLGDLFFIEQNPSKYTKAAVRAKNGHQIMWIFRIREFSACVQDGKYTSLQNKRFHPLFEQSK